MFCPRMHCSEIEGDILNSCADGNHGAKSALLGGLSSFSLFSLDSGFLPPSKALSWGCVQAKCFHPTVRNMQCLHPLCFLPELREWILTDLMHGKIGRCTYLHTFISNMCSACFCCFFISRSFSGVTRRLTHSV